MGSPSVLERPAEMRQNFNNVISDDEIGDEVSEDELCDDETLQLYSMSTKSLVRSTLAIGGGSKIFCH